MILALGTIITVLRRELVKYIIVFVKNVVKDYELGLLQRLVNEIRKSKGVCGMGIRRFIEILKENFDDLWEERGIRIAKTTKSQRRLKRLCRMPYWEVRQAAAYRTRDRETLLYLMENDWSDRVRSAAELALKELEFEEKEIKYGDPHGEVEECLKYVLSEDTQKRENAIWLLDGLRPLELNEPYFELSHILFHLQGKLLSEETMPKLSDLAPVVTDEFIELLESRVIPWDTLREAVDRESLIAMALLHGLYKSPYLAEKFKEFAKKQQDRLYFMRIDNGGEDDLDYYVPLIKPRS
jgi:hypothetical protein